LRQGLCAKGRGDIGAPPRRQPPSRYIQRINARDTLDGLCLELDQFLTNNGQNRLRKCSQCGRYFVQATARLKTYCMMSCQQKANPTKAQKNAAYQRTHRATQRERQLKADLQRVGKVKQEFITTTGAPPPVEDILARLHFGRRRWNMLVNWEMEQHDPPWVTDLTNKYCMRS